jgi:hypothetical protein
MLQGKGQVRVDGWLRWQQFRRSAQDRGGVVVITRPRIGCSEEVENGGRVGSRASGGRQVGNRGLELALVEEQPTQSLPGAGCPRLADVDPHPRVKTQWPLPTFGPGAVSRFSRIGSARSVNRSASRTEYVFFKYHLVRAPKSAKKWIHYPASQLRSACAESHNQTGPVRPDQQRPDLRARERG